MADSLTFVHFSDTHIVRPGVRLRDIDTIETLTRVVATVNGLDPQPAFVVIGGDLVSPDVEPEVKARTRDLTVRDYETSYDIFHSLVGRLNVPVHYVMGNHDRRVPFRRVIYKDPQPTDRPHHYGFSAGQHRICILDSLQPSGMAVISTMHNWLGSANSCISMRRSQRFSSCTTRPCRWVSVCWTRSCCSMPKTSGRLSTR
jgi:3',5'-cyclic-AMP phosphodiesterase